MVTDERETSDGERGIVTMRIETFAVTDPRDRCHRKRTRWQGRPAVIVRTSGP